MGDGGGFLKDGDTFTFIDVPSALYTEAHGINAAGQIIGWFQNDLTGHFHGFLKDGATFTTIDVPGSIRPSRR
jgi:probable HAF family extracellular repeat protein